MGHLTSKAKSPCRQVGAVGSGQGLVSIDPMEMEIIVKTEDKAGQVLHNLQGGLKSVAGYHGSFSQGEAEEGQALIDWHMVCSSDCGLALL